MRITFYFIFLLILFSCQQKEKSNVELNESNSINSEVENLEEIPKQRDSLVRIEESAEQDVHNSQDVSSSNILENLSFTIDTLLTDSKGSLIYLPQGLSKSDLSPNKKFLYALNTKTNNLYQFDLDRLELVDTYQFEKEGPNSVPPVIWKFQLLNENKIGFADYHITGVYNLQTQKLSSYQFSDKDFSNLIEAPTVPKYEELQLSLDGKQIFFLHKNIKEEKVYLGLFDPEKGKEDLIDLDQFGFLTRLYFSHSEGISHHVSNSAPVGMKMEKTRSIIYSKGTSKVYFYNISTGSLAFKAPNHELVPNDQKPPFSNKVSSIQQVIDASNGTVFQISYQEILYDDYRKMYFRFGSILEETENLNSKTKKEVFLFAYDQNFNLVGETQIKELVKVPQYPFFKDGKLWSYVNVEDELGFAVFTFDF